MQPNNNVGGTRTTKGKDEHLETPFRKKPAGTQQRKSSRLEGGRRAEGSRVYFAPKRQEESARARSEMVDDTSCAESHISQV